MRHHNSLLHQLLQVVLSSTGLWIITASDARRAPAAIEEPAGRAPLCATLRRPEPARGRASAEEPWRTALPPWCNRASPLDARRRQCQAARATLRRSVRRADRAGEPRPAPGHARSDPPRRCDEHTPDRHLARLGRLRGARHAGEAACRLRRRLRDAGELRDHTGARQRREHGSRVAGRARRHLCLRPWIL